MLSYYFTKAAETGDGVVRCEARKLLTLLRTKNKHPPFKWTAVLPCIWLT